MNPDQQRNTFPPVPPLFSNTSVATDTLSSSSTSAMQSMPYGSSTQSYLHIPLNPMPGPPYHKIAEPVRQQVQPSSSATYQQYQQGYSGSQQQQPYSQSYTQQQFYSNPQQSGFTQQSYSNTQSMSQQLIPQHIPYQQHSPQPPAAGTAQFSPQKYDVGSYSSSATYQQNSSQGIASQPAPQQSQSASSALPKSSSPITQGITPYSQQQQQTDLSPHQQQLTATMQSSQNAASPTFQAQGVVQSTDDDDTNKDDTTQVAPPTSQPTAEMSSEMADVNPSSPELKLKIKKTFTNSGKAKLTSSFTSGEPEDKSKDSDKGDDDESSSTQESTSNSETGQPSPGVTKPLTVAEKKQNVKAGKAVGLAKAPVAGSKPIPQVYDEKPCEWLVGDLVWSKVSGHPWWPCMVAYDPNLGIYTKMKGSIGKNYRMYHVQFFGEVPERGWVSGSSMRKFVGREQYDELVQEMVSKVKKSERTRLAAKLAIKSSRQKAWDIAVVECQRALPMSRHERKLNFTFKYELPKGAPGAIQAEQIHDVVSLGDSPKMKAKRAYKMLQDDEAAATNTIPAIALPPSDNQTTESSSGKKSVVESEDAPRKKRKYRRRKKDGEEEGPSESESPKLLRKRGRKTAQFLNYVEQKLAEMMAANPALKKREVYVTLEEQWEHLPEEEKAKYVPEAKPSPPRRRNKDPNASPGKRGRKSDQFLAFCEQQKPELMKENPALSKRDVYVAIEKKWEELAEEDKLKYLKKGATPPSERRVRKRKVESPSKSLPVKRSRRETRPSKKLQEADLENLGFTPKQRKALKLAESADDTDTQSNTSGKPSKPPTSTTTRVPANAAPAATASSDVVKPKRGRKHLTNGGSSKKEPKQKKPSITEMSQDFADMQEDDDLILDTDLITSALQSTGELAHQMQRGSNGSSGNNSFLPFPGFSS